ncbi:MAG: 1-phosphofructokinase family hexose kinase [Spirochaetia bacterium]
MFLTIGLNPVLQKTIILRHLHENEVNRSSEYYLDASGKGINTTRVLSHLGEPVVHLTHAGGRNRDLFLNLAESDGLHIRGVNSNSEIRYGYTLLNRENKTTTEIIEEAYPVKQGTQARLLEEYRDLLPQCEIVTFSGSKAAGYTDDLIPEMVGAAKDADKIVILDVRGSDLLGALKYRPDVIMPNLSEFVRTFMEQDTAFLTEHLDDEATLREVGKKMTELYRQFGSVTVLTRGSLATLFVSGNTVERLTPDRLDPVNTIGCGDAFTAGFASAFLKDSSVSGAVEKGHRCAGMNAVHIRPGVLR